MSTLKVDSIESRTSGNRVVLPDTNNYPPFRNIVINGDMSVAQRATSKTSAGSAVGSYDTVDRFAFAEQLGTFTMSQETDVPTGQGFAKSLKLDCTAADASPSSSAYLQFFQRVEGQNLQYLKKGTSSAESLTMSFWVKSNKTGTYILELDDNDNARNINKSYTVNSSNTWEKKIITFDGDTTGVFDNDNGDSLRLIWWLGAGSNYSSGTLATSWESTTNANRAVGQVNLADDTANEWYITGVQLEVGDSATPFEFLPHDVNLQRCERYFYNWISGHIYGNICMGRATGNSTARGVFQFPVRMRTAPSLTANGNFRAVADVSIEGDGSGVTMARSATDTAYIQISYGGSMTTGQCAEMGANNDVDAEILFDAEL